MVVEDPRAWIAAACLYWAFRDVPLHPAVKELWDRLRPALADLWGAPRRELRSSLRLLHGAATEELRRPATRRPTRCGTGPRSGC